MDTMMLAPSVLLIVVTGTGVGKTWTGCALDQALCRGGRRVVAVPRLARMLPPSPDSRVVPVSFARHARATRKPSLTACRRLPSGCISHRA